MENRRIAWGAHRGLDPRAPKNSEPPGRPPFFLAGVGPRRSAPGLQPTPGTQWRELISSDRADRVRVTLAKTLFLLSGSYSSHEVHRSGSVVEMGCIRVSTGARRRLRAPLSANFVEGKPVLTDATRRDAYRYVPEPVIPARKRHGRIPENLTLREPSSRVRRERAAAVVQQPARVVFLADAPLDVVRRLRRDVLVPQRLDDVPAIVELIE